MSLAQPQTLMGLLPQLKNMEESIVSMIIELSTKLANLTDARIFVIVDAAYQRRFRYADHYTVRPRCTGPRKSANNEC